MYSETSVSFIAKPVFLSNNKKTTGNDLKTWEKTEHYPFKKMAHYSCNLEPDIKLLALCWLSDEYILNHVTLWEFNHRKITSLIYHKIIYQKWCVAGRWLCNTAISAGSTAHKLIYNCITQLCKCRGACYQLWFQWQ